MKHSIFILILTMTAAFAGEKIYDSGIELQFGGYRTYPEFLNNMPGAVDSTMEVKADDDSYDPTDPVYSLYYLKRDRIKAYKESLWGFCDGEKVYIKVSAASLFRDSYRELTVRPFFSYFSEVTTISPMVSGGDMSAPDMANTVYYLVNMENGGTTPMTRPTVRDLLREYDVELYKHFLSEGENDEMIKYIDHLNERMSKKK